MTTQGQLIKKIRIQGTITALTGLHIGGTNIAMSIGGADTTVVRNPLNNQPYIPGSSLKGKMRSLLERKEGKFSGGVTPSGPYIQDAEHPICMVFGTTPDDIKKWAKKKYQHEGDERQKQEARRPVSRLIVRDCALNGDSEKALSKARTTDMPYTEVKTEVVIDRITSAATPRQIERVPAGVMFDMTLILNLHHGDDEQRLLDTILQSLKLVQDDYLGGKGTRGSGAVKIDVTAVSYKTAMEYESGMDWQSHEVTIPNELQSKG